MKKNRLLIAAMTAGLALTSVFPSFAGEWKFDGPQKWQRWYQNDDGGNTTNDWQEIDGKWYHFDTNGYLDIGWHWIGQKWFYMQEDGDTIGAMEVNGKYDTGSTGADGVWVSAKTPTNMWIASDEDIAYWNAMQEKYGVADIPYTSNGDGSVSYIVTRDYATAIPDYDNVLRSRACEDFNGFYCELSWSDKIVLKVWPYDSY